MAEISRTNLKNLNLDQFEQLAIDYGKKRFSGRQLYKWVFKNGVSDWNAMTDLSREFREKLAKNCTIGSLNIAKKAKSSDGCIKTLWQTEDGLYIESVTIPDADRNTLCISSQAGCPIGCHFCATGLNGFMRHLTPGEIYDQYLLTAKDDKEPDITNIVFMGMGEPFLNYENVLAACRILNDQLGAGLAAGKITVSTVGLINGIYRMADEFPKLKLAISLHTANQAKREKIIPLAEKYKLGDLWQAAKYYTDKTGNRVTFEYLMLGGFNDGIDDAGLMASYVRGIPCKINLINYNSVTDSKFKPSTPVNIEGFREYLLPRTPIVTIRQSRGADIAAACGQLAGKEKN